MSDQSILVSIIAPCYMQAEFLAETLDSVLSQTYPNWECIIVNDGSPDNTEEIALKYVQKDARFKYLYKENSGVSDTRNVGIKQSKGEYILPLDADDKIDSTYIEKALNVFDHNPETKLVYCQAELFGVETGLWDLPKYNYQQLLRYNQIFCSCIYRRKDYDKTNGYNTNMTYGNEDWDFLISLLSPTDIVYQIEQPLFYYRIKKTSRNKEVTDKLSQMILQMMLNHADLYKDSMDLMVNYWAEGVDYKEECRKVHASYAYRLGKFLLKPFSFIRKHISR